MRIRMVVQKSNAFKESSVLMYQLLVWEQNVAPVRLDSLVMA